MNIKGFIVTLATFLIISVSFIEAGMDQFLRNTMYSIQSLKDNGALTLVDSPQNTYKTVRTKKWNDNDDQKWIVRDFQSIGMYEFTPLVHNTSSNIVSYQLTKNVYSHKRQWKVSLIGNQKYQVQRYQIKNPESGFCLANIGFDQQVDEVECDERYPTNQIWKFRMLRK